MAKNRSAAGITNIVQYDANRNITFVSGSTTLLTVSSSGALTTTGTITAQTLVVQTVTSSVNFITGSTKFGSLIGNTHQFTGSVSMTGSLAVVTNGTEFQVGATGVRLGNALTDAHIISGSLTVNPNGLFVNSSGVVGIGTNSPSFRLDIQNNGSAIARILDTSTNASLILQAGTSSAMKITGYNYNTSTAIPLYISVDGANTIMQSGGGAVGIGTTNPRSFLDVSGATPYIRLTDTAVTGENGLIMDAGGGFIRGGLTINYGTGEFKSFCGVAGNAYFQTFHTNGSERMRITSGGEFYWAVTGTAGSDITNGGVLFRVSGGQKYVQVNHGIDGDSTLIFFYRKSGSNVTLTGSVSTSGNSTLYNTTSDYRIKEDFKDIKGLDKVSAIKVYNFKFKGIENRMDGVIAHELAEVLPYAVSGEKDAIDEEGNIKVQSVDYSKIVPVLVKAIQELKAQNDSLQQQINELKA